jgi:membrane protein DedA with SNARE-associated domain
MQALTSVLVGWLTQAGGWAVFTFMMLESACIPIPSEIVLPFAGVMVSQGHLGFWEAVLIGVAGQLTGSLVAYGLGRRFGLGWLKAYGRYVGIRSHEVEKAEHWLQRYGDLTAFFSRLLPGVRTFVSLPAGMARMPPGRFVLYSALGVTPFTTALVYAGVALGENWDILRPLFHRIDFVIALVILGALAVFLWTRRGGGSGVG